MKHHHLNALESTVLRVAILGCGGRGKEHLAALLADDRVKVVALADSNKDAALALNLEFDLDAKVFGDVQTLLTEERPDIAVIALWTHLHLPVFKACVSAGVRLVMCEKPMAATWEETQEIARLAKKSGVMLTFCHQRRFSRGNRAVRSLLAEGRFGKIERMDLFSPPHLLDCGTHSLDQALSFNAESPIKWVHGAVDLSSKVEFFGIPAEGMFTGIFMFENGVFGTIRTGRLDMDFWGGVRVTCEDGFVEVFWDGEIRRAKVFSDPDWKFPDVDNDHKLQMIDTVHNAVDSLLGGDEPELDYTKALRTAEVLFALYESARCHEHIVLPLKGPVGNPLFSMMADREKLLT